MAVDDPKLSGGADDHSQIREYIADRNNRIKSKLYQTNNALLIERISAYGKWISIGLLALGVCSLFILFGISLLTEPKIVVTEKVVVNERVKVVQTEKIVIQRVPMNVYVQGRGTSSSQRVQPTVSFADIQGRLPENITMGEFNISLMWNTLDDLDLHVTEPNGTTIISYKNKKSLSGGLLTRDLNASSLTVSPVENISWRGREPPNGRFIIEVAGYRQNKKPATEVPFTVSISKSGQVIKEKQGKIIWSAGGNAAKVKVMEFLN
jgi:hypothetical protein